MADPRKGVRLEVGRIFQSVFLLSSLRQGDAPGTTDGLENPSYLHRHSRGRNHRKVILQALTKPLFSPCFLRDSGGFVRACYLHMTPVPSSFCVYSYFVSLVRAPGITARTHEPSPCRTGRTIRGRRT